MNKIIFTLLLLLTSLFATVSNAQYGGSFPNGGGGGYCPTCQLMSNYWNTPFIPSFMNSGNGGGYNQTPPWYTPYGQYSYNNFGFPANGWNKHSMIGEYYPGDGNVLIGKPNIYFSANAELNVKLKLKFQKNANFLVSVPAHATSGWDFKTQKDGTILSDGGTYRYVFYDFRLYSDELQDKAGFCVPMENLMEKLTVSLTKKGFKESEVKDFAEYWSVKMPAAEHYCVYPQENKTVEKVSSYEITPMPTKVERLFFIIVPNHGEYKKLSHGGGKFSKEPTVAWMSKPTDGRSTASQGSGLEVREWGVGFLAL